MVRPAGGPPTSYSACSAHTCFTKASTSPFFSSRLRTLPAIRKNFGTCGPVPSPMKNRLVCEIAGR